MLFSILSKTGYAFDFRGAARRPGRLDDGKKDSTAVKHEAFEWPNYCFYSSMLFSNQHVKSVCMFVCRRSGLGRDASNWTRASRRCAQYATCSVSGSDRLRHRHHVDRLSDRRSWLDVRSISRAGLHRSSGVSGQVAAQSTSGQAVRRPSARRRSLPHVCRYVTSRSQLRYATMHICSLIHSFTRPFYFSQVGLGP